MMSVCFNPTQLMQILLSDDTLMNLGISVMRVLLIQSIQLINKSIEAYWIKSNSI